MDNPIAHFMRAIRHPYKIAVYLIQKGYGNLLPDKIYLKSWFREKLEYPLNLNQPKTFNEKLQWLKLYDRDPRYTRMVDKYEAKKLVASIIGEEYIIPTYGVWDTFDDIDFDALPNQFVLKCTHDSGGVVICKDKNKWDISKAREIMTNALECKYYLKGREWPYKDVRPRIIAEQYMTDGGQDLQDYKIHNFGGIPKIILVCSGRFTKEGLHEDFYDVAWEKVNISRPDHPHSEMNQPKPVLLTEMLEVAKKISKSLSFVRTDFYVADGRLYFSEITFYPASGFEPFYPDSADKMLGDWIALPSKLKRS